MRIQSSPKYNPALAWFAAGTAAWVFVLVTLGALTTSLGAGMVFPDWPLSNGSLNPNGWLTDIAMFSEHLHRLTGATMGLLTLTLAIWLQRAESRAWLRRLGWFAVALVVVQGIIGGGRVRLDAVHIAGFDMTLGQMLRIPHGIIAQVFVCVLFAIAASIARKRRRERGSTEPRRIEDCAGLETHAPDLLALKIARATVALLFVQLIVAALMRHNFAGLAIPTFPFTPDGGFIPAHWDFRIALAFAHRALALGIAITLLTFAASIRRTHPAWAMLLVALLVAQITLGAFAIWTMRNPLLTTAHVVCGASLLAVAFTLTWRLHENAHTAATARRDVQTAVQFSNART